MMGQFLPVSVAFGKDTTKQKGLALSARILGEVNLKERVLRYMENITEYTLLNPQAYNEEEGRYEQGWWPKVINRGKFIYAAAVCLTEPQSKLYQNGELLRKVKSTMLWHAKDIIEADEVKHYRGAWGGMTEIDGPRDGWGWAVQNWWQATWLLIPYFSDGEKDILNNAWDSWYRICSDEGKEYYGAWLSTNKFSATPNILFCYTKKRNSPQMKDYQEKVLKWYWQAWPEEGMVDKKMWYYLHTLTSVPDAMLVSEEWTAKALPKIEMLRSLIAPGGYLVWESAGRPEDLRWGGFSEAGTLAKLFLIGAQEKPYLACLAQRIIEEKFPLMPPPPVDGAVNTFLLNHSYDCPEAFIVQMASLWEPVLKKTEIEYEDLKFFDYWRGLGNLAVKTKNYHALCFPHFGHCFEKQFYGAGLYALSTAGSYYRTWTDYLSEHLKINFPPAKSKPWLFYRDPTEPKSGDFGYNVKRIDYQLNAYKDGVNIGRPPDYPEQTWVAGIPRGTLYGGVSCKYQAANMEVRTTNGDLMVEVPSLYMDLRARERSHQPVPYIFDDKKPYTTTNAEGQKEIHDRTGIYEGWPNSMKGVIGGLSGSLWRGFHIPPPGLAILDSKAALASVQRFFDGWIAQFRICEQNESESPKGIGWINDYYPWSGATFRINILKMMAANPRYVILNMGHESSCGQEINLRMLAGAWQAFPWGKVEDISATLAPEEGNLTALSCKGRLLLINHAPVKRGVSPPAKSDGIVDAVTGESLKGGTLTLEAFEARTLLFK